MKRRLAAPFALVAALAACSSSGTPPPLARTSPGCTLVPSGYGPAGAVPVRAEVVITGLEVPWGIAFLPGGDWLVTERPGRIRLVRGGALVPEPVATVAITQGGESGLMGIALHPDFEKTRFFSVMATVDAGGTTENRVLRYRLADDHRSAVLDRVILRGVPAAKYHDGGRIRFGPDGMLHVGTGDARDPPLAQAPASMAGKLLRLTPDGAVPPDNPFPGSPVLLRGIRNTQGFDWLDAKTIVLTDHGPSGDTGRRGHDEVTIAHAGDNLGWPDVYACETAAGRVPPSLTWDEAVPPGGAAIYRGSAIPEWRNSLLVGTLRSKHLHLVAFDPANMRRVARHEVYFQGDPPGGLGRLREVVMGPDGHLYVSTSNCDGRGSCPADKDRIVRITR